MPKFSNEYTEEDFRRYAQSILEQAKVESDRINEAIIDTMEGRRETCFSDVFSQTREIRRLLSLHWREVYYHADKGQLPQYHQKLALRVSRHIRRLNKGVKFNPDVLR